MDKRLKILQTQFDNDSQLLEGAEGGLKRRLQEDLDNLKFEIETLKRSNQLQVQKTRFNYEHLLVNS